MAACPSQSRSSAKRTTKALRSLLRYLHAEGLIERRLDHAVPAASGWRLASLPKRLEPGQITRLLATCDRAMPAGRRDFAILVSSRVKPARLATARIWRRLVASAAVAALAALAGHTTMRS